MIDSIGVSSVNGLSVSVTRRTPWSCPQCGHLLPSPDLTEPGQLVIEARIPVGTLRDLLPPAAPDQA